MLKFEEKSVAKSLNAELNPICHLLALVGVHHILHIIRVRVKNYGVLNAMTSLKSVYLHVGPNKLTNGSVKVLGSNTGGQHQAI